MAEYCKVCGCKLAPIKPEYECLPLPSRNPKARNPGYAHIGCSEEERREMWNNERD